jgi:hypothetical protein
MQPTGDQLVHVRAILIGVVCESLDSKRWRSVTCEQMGRVAGGVCHRIAPGVAGIRERKERGMRDAGAHVTSICSCGWDRIRLVTELNQSNMHYHHIIIRNVWLGIARFNQDSHRTPFVKRTKQRITLTKSWWFGREPP